MSTTHVFGENYYSLNSPDPASLSPSSPSSSRSRLSVSSPRSARRVSSQPSLPSPNSLAPPLPTHPPLPHFPAHVLTTPDPGEAVQPARRSVQIGSGGPVNWSRPFPTTHTPPPVLSVPIPVTAASSPTHSPRSPRSATAPARSPTSPSRQRTMSASLAIRSSPYRGATGSPASSASDDEIPTTPTFLPPGAASPEHPPPPASQRSWAVVSDCKGLGMVGIAEFDADPISVIPEDMLPYVPTSSCSSSEGSLGGDSVSTATSGLSVPSTPTRLLFVSETLESLSYPATLDELRSLRAKAAELDMESKRLRRLRGREPPVSPRLVPRKKVPAVTAIELQAAPKPRRPAVRHSLITHSPSADPAFAFLDDGPALPMPSAFSFKSLAAAPDQAAAAASRRPFYAQGKAALSVIEFSSSHKQQQHNDSTPSLNPFGMGRSRHVSSMVPTLASLRREKSERSDRSHLQQFNNFLPPIPAYSPTSTRGPAPSSLSPTMPPTVTTSPPSPSTPFAESTNRSSNINLTMSLSLKPSRGFLDKHKKLSRFLGKPQVV